ncbi:MAG: hypothetical protein SFV15_15555 [Polyangiaceae bacterium]|nr:hypothetical protein [Polyangiaceae bacterium]
MNRKIGWLVAGILVLSVGAVALVEVLTYPSDKTPTGAYLRIVKAVNTGRPEDFFAYLETPAQHACYSIRDYRKRSLARILATFPEPERSRLAAEYASIANAPDGADVFAIYARQEGWLNRLRRDLSGVARVEQTADRASVETARGTRYPFRVRPENGIWGLTLFTAKLVAEAERAARDSIMLERAAEDYARVSATKKP